jgi:glycine hydroxymethyltransferase
MAYQIQIPARSRRSGILNIATAHEERRRSTINLVASENLMSPAALKMLGSDFAHRYCIPPAGERPAEIWDYPNQRFSRALEAEAKELACELFHGKTADVRPLSGNNIVGILLTSLTKAGDTLLSVPPSAGGHFATTPVARRLRLTQAMLPYDSELGTVDLDKTKALARTVRPKLIYLDASMILFPYPVAGLRAIFGDDCTIVYDASHCFGIIAGGCFQAPLPEGADFISGSTHKTMFGPQKGLIVARDDKRAARTVLNAITPLFVSNSHVHHIAALAVALEELAEFGPAYARQVVRNAKALGAAMAGQGADLMFENRDFTESHQLICLLRPDTNIPAQVIKLEEAGLHVNGISAPFTSKPALRLGVAELTRRGFEEPEMRIVARCLADVLFDRRPVKAIASDVRELSLAHPGLKFGFDEDGRPLSL